MVKHLDWRCSNHMLNEALDGPRDQTRRTKARRLSGEIPTQPSASVSLPHLDVMFWRLDQQIGLSSRSVAFDWARRAADLIHDNGVFKFLTQGDRLVFVVPEIAYGDLELHADVWASILNAPVDVPGEDKVDIELVARYLVVSRNQLLMVKRYRPMNMLWTESFRVYRLEQLHLGQSPEEDHFRWVELAELDGRMLFVARGCSVAFEVHDFADYPKAVEGVYFKGDVAEFDDLV